MDAGLSSLKTKMFVVDPVVVLAHVHHLVLALVHDLVAALVPAQGLGARVAVVLRGMFLNATCSWFLTFKTSYSFLDRGARVVAAPSPVDVQSPRASPVRVLLASRGPSQGNVISN